MRLVSVCDSCRVSLTNSYSTRYTHGTRILSGLLQQNTCKYLIDNFYCGIYHIIITVVQYNNSVLIVMCLVLGPLQLGYQAL